MPHKDRRKAKRYLLSLPIQFFIYPPSRPDNISPGFEAEIHDISELGMRILTDHVRSEDLHILSPNLTTSEQCLLKIEIPADTGKLTLQGKVIWYDRSPDSSPFSFPVGIEFLEFSPEMKERLRELIQQKSGLKESP